MPHPTENHPPNRTLERAPTPNTTQLNPPQPQKMATQDQTIGVPQLVIILMLSGLAIRYLFFSPSSASSGTSASRAANNLRAREADVDHILQMWPQADRRSIMWDLQRNGGNLAATTERMLSGRGLETVCYFLYSAGYGWM